MTPKQRIAYALIISMVLHIFVLVKIHGKGGGRSGPLAYPGLLLVELANLASSGAKAGVTTEATPFKTEAPESIDEPETKKPQPTPSLSKKRRHGKSPVRDRKKTEDKDRASDSDGGLVPGEPAGPETDAPELDADDGPDGLGDRGRPGEPDSDPEPVVRKARCARCPPPEYPRQALARGLEGTVVLSLEILPDGAVGDAYVVSGPGFGILENEALAAVKKWTFYPATEDDQPVSSTKKVQIPFSLTPR